MVDLTITAANIVPQSNANIENGGIAGVAIAAGDIVYKDPADGKFKLADADSTTQAIQEAYGMAMNSAAIGQSVSVLKSGDVAMGAILTAGSRYYLSSTPGKIEPEADLSVGEEINLLGIAKSTTVLAFRIIRPGVTL